MMSKYTNLLFKTLMIPILFSNFQMVLGNEKNINEQLENSKAKDWIEELKEDNFNNPEINFPPDQMILQNWKNRTEEETRQTSINTS